MTDFLITEMTFYPWFTWLVVVLAIGGVAWWSVLLGQGVAFVSDWAGHKREAWRYKTAVMRDLREGDPPEYEPPDDDDLDYCEHGVIGRTCTRCGYDWDGPGEDWSPGLAWGPGVLPHETRTDMAGLAEVLSKAKAMGLLDDEPCEHEYTRNLAGDYEWCQKCDSVRPVGNCTNRDCYRYGEPHPGACDLAQTQPAACYTDGPAMPPQPVREWLHPAIMDSLEAAGFSEHETNDGAVDSMWTRAMAREVEAMVTDGIIPTGEAGKD